MELSIVESNKGDIVINPNDASNLGVNAGDLISLTQTSTGNRILGTVEVQSDMESGTVGVSSLLMLSNGIEDGAKMDTNIYQENLVQINSLDLGIENMVGSKKRGDVLQRVREKENILIKLMKNKAFQKGSSFILKELDIQLSVIDTKPELSDGDVAKFNGIQDFSYTWPDQDDHDNIPMADLSGNKNIEDVVVADNTSVIIEIEEPSTEQEIKCPVCGTINPPNSDKCTNCSTILSIGKKTKEKSASSPKRQSDTIGTKPESSGGNISKSNEIQNSPNTRHNKLNGYDSILMVDLSGSMDTEDMVIGDKTHEIIEANGSKFTNKHGTVLIERMRDKELVSRIDGTALAVLNYSQIKRQNNAFGMVYFSDEGIPVKFPNGTHSCSSAVPIAEFGEAMLGEIAKNWHGLTNLEDGLIKAIEVAKELDHQKHKMIVLLMDGKPENMEECIQIVDRRIVPRKDMIINTLGYGDSVDEEFLMTIANKTGGEYHKVQDTDDLIDIFSNFAVEFKIHGSKELLDLYSIRGKAVKTDPTEVYCKKCGQHASFLGKYGRWYCDSCKKYLEKGNFQNKCAKCKKPLTFLGNSKRWFCYDCNAFDRESR